MYPVYAPGLDNFHIPFLEIFLVLFFVCLFYFCPFGQEENITSYFSNFTEGTEKNLESLLNLF